MLPGVLIALCALLIVAIFTVRDAARRRARKRRWSDLPEVQWLEPGESPVGRRVLDCRGFCRLMRSTTRDPGMAARFVQTQRSRVSELSGQLPDGAHGHPVRWRFSGGDVERMRAGFHAEVMEDKWMIRHADGRLYFQRSWTGALVYVAELSSQASGAAEEGGGVACVWLRRSDAESPEQEALSLAIARYLIESHLLRQPAALPVPADLAGDPQKMALFTFSIAGRHGDYAEPFYPECSPLN